MFMLGSSAFALVLAGLASAAAVKRQSITPLSSSQISSYAPFTHFASTAYCNPSTTINWSCGGALLPALSPPCAVLVYSCSSSSQLPGKPRLCASGVWGRWRCNTVLWDITITDLFSSHAHVASAQGMSGSPRRRKPSLSPTRVPIPVNCEPDLLRCSYLTVAHFSRQLRRPD